MIKFTFYLALAFILFSCSSNDSSNDSINQEEQNNDSLKIKKVISENDLAEYTYITYFRENGTIEKRLGFNNITQNEESVDYELYFYNNQQNLIAIKHYNNNHQFVRDLRTYTYNSSNQLISMIDFGDTSDTPYQTNFTYTENRVDFLEEETNKSGYVILNSTGKIIETSHDKTGTGQITTHYLIYDNEALTEINVTYKNYSFTTDQNPNPLFKNFYAKPMQYMVHEHYLFDIDFTGSYYYLKNNITNLILNTDNGSSNFQVTDYQYNSLDFPTTSNTTRYDDVVVTKTYEYY